MICVLDQLRIPNRELHDLAEELARRFRHDSAVAAARDPITFLLTEADGGAAALPRPGVAVPLTAIGPYLMMGPALDQENAPGVCCFLWSTFHRTASDLRARM